MSIRTTSRIGKLVALATVLFCAGMFTGCGNFFQAITSTTTTTTGSGGDMVYVGKNGSSSIYGYQVSAGGLTQVSGATVSLAAPPTAMVVNATDTFLYVGTTSGIYGFSIASTGALTALSSGALLASSIIPVSMDVSADNNWLIVLSSSLANGIYIFPLNTTTGIPGTVMQYLTVPTTGLPRAIKFAPNENTSTVSVVGAAFGTYGNCTYTFNSSTGVLAIASPCNAYVSSGTTASDDSIAFNSAGTEMYVARGGSNTVIATYLLNSNGVAVDDLEYTSGNGPDAITLSKSGSYVYAANLTDSTISGWSVGTSTSANPVTLTPLTVSAPYSTLASSPGAIAYDNSGSYILAFNQGSPPDLVQYTIDTVTSPGRLYVSGSVTTGLTNSVTVGSGVVMAVTH